MTQNKDVLTLKRIKHLFRIFLKQFEVDEYKLLMQFLQLSINKYNADQFIYEAKSNKNEPVDTIYKSPIESHSKFNPFRAPCIKFDHL